MRVSDAEINAFIAEKIMGYKWMIRYPLNKIYLIPPFDQNEWWRSPNECSKKGKSWDCFVPNYINNVDESLNVIKTLEKRRMIRGLFDVYINVLLEGNWNVRGRLTAKINSSLARALCLAIYKFYKERTNGTKRTK